MKTAEIPVLEIFFYDGHLGVAPTLLGLSRLWAERGGQVHIYTRPRPYPKPDGLHANVQVHLLSSPPGRWMDLKCSKKHPLILLQGFFSLLSLLIFTMQCLLRSLHLPDRRSKRVAIGVDLFGTLTRHAVGIFIKSRAQFLALELPPYPYTPLPVWAQGIARSLAQDGYHGSESILVQDGQRLSVVEKYFGKTQRPVFFIPNAPLDAAEEMPTAPNYFRAHLDLDPVRFPHIALNAGMIGRQTCAEPLARAFAPISRNWALVYHDRTERSPDSAFYQKLRQANSTNLFFSTRPVSYREIRRIYSAATVGLVFYQNPAGAHDDWNSIAMASGKLAHLLQYGKPVLVSPMPSLIRLIETHDCGMVIQRADDTREIECALETLMGDYARYSANARRCFQECFDFRKFAGPFFSYLAPGNGGPL